MARRRSALVVLAVVGLAGTAQARFGKAGSSSSASSSSASSSSASTSTSTKAPSGSSNTHGAVPVGQAPASSGAPSATRWSWGWRRGNPYRHGYYSGSYVPSYGYGYAACERPVATGAIVYGTEGAGQPGEVAQEPSSLRLSAAADGMVFVNGPTGLTLGVAASIEGERWGLSVLAQDVFVRADDGSTATDTIPQLNAHLTFAFLSGRYGRLRAEAGADTVFAPDRVFIGATVGLSGTLWIGGPFAVEGAVMATPYPFWQLDYRGGLVVGLGPFGLRAGWRTQVLDDRGLVDGLIHRDVFMGPYVGLGITL